MSSFPRIRFSRFLFAFALIVPVAAFTQPKQNCTPAFSAVNDWQGADAAYSIPLRDGRVVWIFGDTLYGDKRVVINNIPRMVHNSIGISHCDAGKWNLTYIIRKNADSSPSEFFHPQHPKTWYWALDGFTTGKELWVTLLCIRNVPKPTSWAFDFATCGTDLARVTHLNDDPQKWQVSYFPLVPDGTRAYPSAASLVYGKDAYIFALYESGSRPNLLTRIPLNGLGNPQASLTYLGADGAWHPGFNPAKAKEIMHHGTSELSVHYHPELHRWISVMMNPAGLSNQTLLRTAPELTGPWTEGEVIYRIPEMEPSNPHYDKDTFCYAAKEHPEFESHGDLLFTYVCNTTATPKLETETNIYFPQVVRMPMPAAASY